MQKYSIEKSIKELKDKFYNIKKIPFHKSLRKGSTGIGYTFEKLIGKEEDSNYEPDFKGIEIKTKYRYSKSPLTLFGLVGKRSDTSNIYKYLVNNFGRFKDNRIIFSSEVYANKFSKIRNGLLWKLKINLEENKLRLLIIDCNFNIIDDNIYWNLDDVKERLLTKLKYLAIVKGYPYFYKGQLYYKYTNLNFYKLKGFNEFLNLLAKGDIFICINISYDIVDNKTVSKNRNIEFRLNINAINDLFDKIS